MQASTLERLWPRIGSARGATASPSPRAALTGYAVAAGFLLLAYRQMQAGDLLTEGWLAAAALACGAAGRWAARASNPLPFIGAATICLALGVQVGNAAGIATAIALAVVVLIVLHSERIRILRAARLAYFAGGLTSVMPKHPTGEGDFTRVRWSGIQQAESIEWRHPETVPVHEDATAAKIRDVANARLGGTYAVSVNPGAVRFARQKESEVKAPTSEPVDDSRSPSDEIALQSIADDVIGSGAKVKVNRNEGGDIEECSITWPPEQGAKVSGARDRKKLEQRLSDTLEWTESRASWSMKDQRVSLREVNDYLPDRIDADPKYAEDEAVVFGVLRGGGYVKMLLAADREPHCLAAGPSRAGKSTFLRSFLGMFPNRDQAEMVLADPKRIELNGLEALPSVIRRDRTAHEIAAGIELIYDRMMKRYAEIEDDPTKRKHYRAHRLLWVCDEGKQAYDMLQQAHKDDGERGEHPAIGKLRQILQLGGAAGVHVLMLTQQADADWLGTSARGNFGIKVVLGAVTAESARMMFGNRWAYIASRAKGTDEDGDPIKGRVTVQTGTGQRPREGQVFWTPEFGDPTPEDHAILTRLGLVEPADDDPEADQASGAAEVSSTAAPAPPTNRARMRPHDAGHRLAAGADPTAYDEEPEPERVEAPSPAAEHGSGDEDERQEREAAKSRPAAGALAIVEDDTDDEPTDEDATATEERAIENVTVGDVILTEEEPPRAAEVEEVEEDEYDSDVTVLTLRYCDTGEVEALAVDGGTVRVLESD